jgi:hypothetical protein
MLTAPARADNPLFFQNIAAAPTSAYAGVLDAATPRGVLRNVLDYNYTMAALGAAKYRLVGRALLLLRVAIPLWMLLLIVAAARGA